MGTTESNELKESIDYLSKYFVEKLRLPVTLAYISVLVFYNWDILFYLAFENRDALGKITYVKNRFGPEYYNRVLNPALIAIVASMLISAVQVGINYLISFFKKIDLNRVNEEEMLFAKNKRKVLTELTGTREMETLMLRNQELESEMQKSNEQIKKITDEKSELTKTNQELKEKVEQYEQIQSHDIEEKTSRKLAILDEINRFEASIRDDEKRQLKELVNKILEGKNKYISQDDAIGSSGYKPFLTRCVNFLAELDLINETDLRDKKGYRITELGHEILYSFASGEY